MPHNYFNWQFDSMTQMQMLSILNCIHIKIVNIIKYHWNTQQLSTISIIRCKNSVYLLSSSTSSISSSRIFLSKGWPAVVKTISTPSSKWTSSTPKLTHQAQYVGDHLGGDGASLLVIEAVERLLEHGDLLGGKIFILELDTQLGINHRQSCGAGKISDAYDAAHVAATFGYIFANGICLISLILRSDRHGVFVPTARLRGCVFQNIDHNRWTCHGKAEKHECGCRSIGGCSDRWSICSVFPRRCPNFIVF